MFRQGLLTLIESLDVRKLCYDFCGSDIRLAHGFHFH
jgi:hypothetical protein